MYSIGVPPQNVRLDINKPICKGVVVAMPLLDRGQDFGTAGARTGNINIQNTAGNSFRTTMSVTPVGAGVRWPLWTKGGLQTNTNSSVGLRIIPDAISAGVNPPYAQGTPVSLSYWTKANTTTPSAGGGFPVSYGNNSAGSVFGPLMISTTVISASASTLTFATYSIPDFGTNIWHHEVLTIDSNGIGNLYHDGVLLGTSSTTTSTFLSTVSQLCIGFGQTITANRWDGITSNIAVWNRAISAEEVRLLYTNPWAMYKTKNKKVIWAPPPIAGNPIQVPKGSFWYMWSV